MIVFIVNIGYSWKRYPAGDNPWDAQTLEWFTTSPPPHHNFYRLPQIRSERPTWDYNHPEHTPRPSTATTRTTRRCPSRERRRGDHAATARQHGTEIKVLLSLGTFFGVMCVVYWNWSHENAGSVMMFAGMLLCFFPGGYYFWWSRRMKAATRGRAARHPGRRRRRGRHVPGISILPFTLGMGAFFVVLALVFGIWFLVPGLGLVAWAAFGGTAEGRRGGHH